jgi:hypothetical protein
MRLTFSAALTAREDRSPIMKNSIRCMWMRGGTSKGASFLAEDLDFPWM